MGANDITHKVVARNADTFLWQFRTGPSDTWKTADTANLQVAFPGWAGTAVGHTTGSHTVYDYIASMNGVQFRCLCDNVQYGLTRAITNTVTDRDVNAPPLIPIIVGLSEGYAQHNIELLAVSSALNAVLDYEWQEDGAPIPGATSDTFIPVIGTNVSDKGALRCKVTSDGVDFYTDAYEIRYAGAAVAAGNLSAQSLPVNVASAPFNPVVDFSLPNNRLTHSRDTSGWINQGSNDLPAMAEGVSGADTMTYIEGAGGGQGVVGLDMYSITVAPGQTTVAVDIRPGSAASFNLTLGGYDTVSSGVYWQLPNYFSFAGVDDYGLIDLGNGIYRLWCTMTTTSDLVGSCTFRISDKQNGNMTLADRSPALNAYVDRFQINDGPLPAGYIQTNGVAIPVSPLVKAWSATDLPAGLVVNGSTGERTGTPTEQGAATISYVLTDQYGRAVSSPQEIEITDAPAVMLSGLTTNPSYGKAAEVGTHAGIGLVSDFGTITAQSWSAVAPGGTDLGTGTSPADFSASDTGDLDNLGVLYGRAVVGGSNYDVSVVIRGTSNPVFSAQPTTDALRYEPGNAITFTPGTSVTPGTIEVVMLQDNGEDVLGDLVGNVYTTFREAPVQYREKFTGSGGDVFSDIISVPVSPYAVIVLGDVVGEEMVVTASKAATLKYLVDKNQTRTKAQIDQGANSATSLVGSALVGAGGAQIPLDLSGLDDGTYYVHAYGDDNLGGNPPVDDSSGFEVGAIAPPVGNPPVYAGTEGYSGSSSGPTTPALPLNIAPGDLGILLVTGQANGTVAAPAGWTSLGKSTTSTSSTARAVWAFYRVFDGTTDTPPSVTCTGSGNFAIILKFDGAYVAGGAPCVLATTQLAVTNTITGGVVERANSYILCAVGIGEPTNNDYFDQWANANIPAIAELYAWNTGQGNDFGMGIAGGAKVSAAAGAFADTTVINTATSKTNTAMHIEIFSEAA